VNIVPRIHFIKGEMATVFHMRWLKFDIGKIKFKDSVELIQANSIYILKLPTKYSKVPRMFLSSHWKPVFNKGKYLIGKTSRPLKFDIIGRKNNDKVWQGARLR
jgi:hypothetical protein